MMEFSAEDSLLLIAPSIEKLFVSLAKMVLEDEAGITKLEQASLLRFPDEKRDSLPWCLRRNITNMDLRSAFGK